MLLADIGCLNHELMSNRASILSFVVTVCAEMYNYLIQCGPHVCIFTFVIHCVIYLFFQAMFPLFQADLLGPHQLQSLFGDSILQVLHAINCCCPRGLAKFPLIGFHSLI